MLTDERPGSAWFDRGTARVLFDVDVDVDVAGGLVRSITFRTDPGLLSRDATHQEARDAMKSCWRHPEKSLGW